MNRFYGLRGPDPVDNRDYQLAFSRKLKLPRKYSVKSQCVPLFNQGALGSCVANAGVFASEFNDFNDGDFDFTHQSRLMAYYLARVMVDGGDPTDDNGTYIRSIIKALKRYGTCMESLWPYIPEKFADKPEDICFADAIYFKIRAAHRILTLFDTKACVVSGKPHLMGIPIYPSFEKDEAIETGKVPMPRWWESVVGYHAVCITGFDDNDCRVECPNWWGLNWGNKGYFTLPYKYLEKYVFPQGMGDCWAITR